MKNSGLVNQGDRSLSSVRVYLRNKTKTHRCNSFCRPRYRRKYLAPSHCYQSWTVVKWADVRMIVGRDNERLSWSNPGRYHNCYFDTGCNDNAHHSGYIARGMNRNWFVSVDWPREQKVPIVQQLPRLSKWEMSCSMNSRCSQGYWLGGWDHACLPRWQHKIDHPHLRPEVHPTIHPLLSGFGDYVGDSECRLLTSYPQLFYRPAYNWPQAGRFRPYHEHDLGCVWGRFRLEKRDD